MLSWRNDPSFCTETWIIHLDGLCVKSARPCQWKWIRGSVRFVAGSYGKPESHQLLAKKPTVYKDHSPLNWNPFRHVMFMCHMELYWMIQMIEQASCDNFNPRFMFLINVQGEMLLICLVLAIW